MKAYKKSLWIVVPVVALAATFVWNGSASGRVGRIANRTMKDTVSTSPMPGLGASAFAVCESTGFEAVEGPCGWELGWLCGSTFTACGGPPNAANCTGNPIADEDCCITNPNPLNGWYLSGSSQQCNQPVISNLNPSTGEQHMRMERDPTGGNPAGCTGFGGACRLNAFSPSVGAIAIVGPTHMEMDIAMNREILTPPFGSTLLYFSVEDTASGTAVAIQFHYQGVFFIYTYATNSYAFAGYMSGLDVYDHLVVELDPCNNSAQYFVNGALALDTTIDEGESQISRGIFNSNNVGFYHDIDNYLVTRGPECATVCGDGTVEGFEECEPGAPGDDVCPGRCVAAGEVGECTCTRVNDTCDTPRVVNNGVNGPFLTDGAFYSYTADAPFTSINTCGSDYDTTLLWNAFNDCSEGDLFNDECNTFGAEIGQDPGDPSAPCYVNAALPFDASDFPLSSCLCAPTPPGTYKFVVAEYGGTEPGVGSNTVINITKKTACGTPIPGGACCHGLTGTCVDNVSAAECNGTYDTYSANKLCSMVPPCVAVEGACCNSNPGAGGACSQTTQANCQGAGLTWTAGATCASVACAEVQGACCNRLLGSCSSTLQGACNCADCVWTMGSTCAQVTCTPIQGACCVATQQSADCTQTSQADCATAGGVWTRETDCANVACDPLFTPIPTVSEWGLVIMALMLLVGGKIYFGRRQAVTA